MYFTSVGKLYRVILILQKTLKSHFKIRIKKVKVINWPLYSHIINQIENI